MLFPIDIIAAILYYSLLIESGRVGNASSLSDTIFTTLLIFFFCLLTAEIVTRLLASQIKTRCLSATLIQALGSRVNTIFRIFLVIAYIMQIELAGWPGGIPQALDLDGSELAKACLGLLPFVLMLSLSWFSFFRLDRLISPGRWKLGDYVSFRIRFTLFILVPWLCMWTIYDLARLVYVQLIESGWMTQEKILAFLTANPAVAMSASLLLLIIVVLFSPVILVRIWKCKPLTSPEYLEKLTAIQNLAGIKFSRIYVWHLGGSGFINAAVVGFAKPFRFLLLSEGLLKHLTPDEISAVVGHETGHVKYHHLLWYLFFTSAFISTVLSSLESIFVSPQLQALALCLIMALYLRLVFGFISRNFERQADLYSLELLQQSRLLVDSLEKIAFLSGGTREASSWHHGSIAERVEFLRKAEAEPKITRRHHENIRRIKLVGVVFIALSLSGMYFTYSNSLAEFHANPISPQLDHFQEYRHWLRIEKLLKNDPDAPRQLAQLALSNKTPDKQIKPGQIAFWVKLALKRAQTPAQHEQAEKLLQQFRKEYGLLP